MTKQEQLVAAIKNFYIENDMKDAYPSEIDGPLGQVVASCTSVESYAAAVRLLYPDYAELLINTYGPVA